ncbi:MAG: N-acetyl-gamma-glutamyl-phosphate reductase [Myxococcales bacterium]|nr:N-acetyl-gamma-glutamyl-phosphate reductase [Myxococcales bacterium]
MATRPAIFIDGEAGTIGLRIRELLGGRDDLALLSIDPAQRKDANARRDLLRSADVAILCLPDAAAREAVALLDGADTRVIDGSTAHRVAEGWVFGLPELQPEQRAAIAGARRVANPGCYPTGITLLLRPLIDARALAADAPLSIHALSGYSGGGRPTIELWEAPGSDLATLPFEAPYATERKHKHIAEVMRHAGLRTEPYFEPAKGAFRCGMRVQIPLHRDLLAADFDADTVVECLQARYADSPFIDVGRIDGALSENGAELDPRRCNDTNRVELRVLPHPSGHLLLVAILDNLGKGASGAAVQSLNLMLGLPEAHGLVQGLAKA